MSETKGYCDNHVYMSDKLLNSGDFVHILYRENHCPYCQLSATQAELEEAKESARVWEDRFRKRGYVMEEHAQALKERDELRKYLNDATQSGYATDKIIDELREAAEIDAQRIHLFDEENQSLRAECERLKAEANKERIEADKACVRSGDRWKQYDAERQDHRITKKELADLRRALEEVGNLKGDHNIMRAPHIAREALGMGEK